ncbi:MAG: family 20 glycosylhydrolase, partial [Propionibacteriaceae bacterium]|nr:family 20 glycosylhydrolase [Propionibacteriaceae bacterium]
MTHTQQSRRKRFFALIASAALILGLAPAVQASAADPVNLGLNRPATASGQEVAGRWGPELAFDGEIGPVDPTPGPVHNAADASRWSADVNDAAWIQVDFGAAATVNQVKVRWGNTYATTYKLLGSINGEAWTELKTGIPGPTARGTWTTGDLVDATGVRHLRLQIAGKSQQWALSIWEIQAMGTLDGPVIEPPQPASVDVIPKPAAAVATDAGAFQLTSSTPIVATGDALSTATMLAETLRASTGLPLPVASESAKAITLNLAPDSEIAPEGYEFSSTAEGVNVTASDRAGLFYGTQTLLQLLGPWARSADAVVQDWSVAALDIEDAPRYGYRGLMLDPARSFIETDEVKNVIDQMAAYKMNVLHMHLSDDQGWRIAISNEDKADGDDIDYSLLATKSGATAVTIADGTSLPGRTGFYTADDFAEIVSYADAHNIAIVPEIDGPAHSNAILHAIPQLNSANSFPKLKPGETTVPPNVTTSVGESSLDARNEKTYTFMKHVIADLLAKNTTTVHGTRYFHIGGDESEKNTTKQDYRTFMGRVSADVKAAGAVPIVWNEGAATATAELPGDTVVQYWTAFKGLPETQNFLATHPDSKVLVSHASHTYIPQRPGPDVYGPAWACGGAACGITEFYDWDPTAKAGVSQDRVLGVETAQWSERTRSETSLEFQLYSRMMATAEVGWTPQNLRSLADFKARMASLGTSLTVTGRNFYPSD